MKSTSFKETNHVYGAGDNPNTDQLAVCICKNPEMSGGQNIPFVVSKWKLSEEEVKLIQERGEIWISVMGSGIPPMLPMAHNPFTEGGFKPLEK